MRQIKFRGKRKIDGKWVYGDLLTNSIYHECVILENGVINHSVHPETIGQFTGLQDKNKVDIYEGDILQVKTQSGRIEDFTVTYGIHRRQMKSGWVVDIPSFAFLNDGFPSYPIVDNYLNGHDLDIIEIIGNIHEPKQDNV